VVLQRFHLSPLLQSLLLLVGAEINAPNSILVDQGHGRPQNVCILVCKHGQSNLSEVAIMHHSAAWIPLCALKEHGKSSLCVFKLITAQVLKKREYIPPRPG
jgi:hypothetical protein